jgi:CBS domain-containing protein
MMVVESASEKRVVGLCTSRDLLRIVAKGIREGLSSDDIFNQPMGEYMTPISQVIYARPDETVGMCRTIMAKLGIKCLPILSREGRVEGLLTARDMADFGMEAEDRGGKKSYLRDVSERVGLSSNTSMAEPPAYLQAHLALEQAPLYANIGIAELPHPFKTEDGVGMNRRGEFILDYNSYLGLKSYFSSRSFNYRIRFWAWRVEYKSRMV